VQTLGKVEDTGYRVFRHRQRVTATPRCRNQHRTAP
jgi:hypothetical protein